MTRTLPTVFCFLALFALAARAAADQPQHALGFAVDAGLASSRDDILVPRASSGPRIGLGAMYAGMLGPGTLHAQLHLALSALFDRDAYTSLAVDHALSADYVLDLGEMGGLRHALGPALGMDCDILAISDWDDAHAYWIAYRFLGVAWRAFTPAWRGMRWDLSVELPLLGLLSRPPSYRMNKQDALDQVSFFFVDVQRHPRAAWLEDVQQLRVALDLWHSTSQSFVTRGWALGAETRITHAAAPRSAFAFRAGLRFSAVWGL